MIVNHICYAFTWCGLLIASPGLGQQPPPGSGGIDPKAEEILGKMCKYLGGAKQFTFTADDMTDEMMPNGQKIQFACTRKIAMRRPNRIHGESEGDRQDDVVWYDGKTVTLFDKRQGVYGVLDAPDTIDATLDHVAQTFGIIMPLADLLFSDPCSMVSERTQRGEYMGLHQVLGEKCHHLAFQQESLDWQIWIEDGEQPLPRKLVLTFKAVPGQPQYIALLHDWNMSPELPDSVFVSAVPPDAQKTEIEPLAKRAVAGRASTEKPEP